jgi:hypothetical protein
MKIFIELGIFYSPGDEKRLFEALHSLGCVRSIHGQGLGVHLDIELKELSRAVLEDLLVLLWRYGIDVRPFNALADRNRRFAWIKDEGRVWHCRRGHCNFESGCA